MLGAHAAAAAALQAPQCAPDSCLLHTEPLLSLIFHAHDDASVYSVVT